jgi:hypothetical protein
VGPLTEVALDEGFLMSEPRAASFADVVSREFDATVDLLERDVESIYAMGIRREDPLQ